MYITKDLSWTELYHPQKSYIQALTPNTSECDCIFRDRAFKEVIKLKLGH